MAAPWACCLEEVCALEPKLPLTLYYDGHCPLCLKEVGWLARRARPGDLELVDLHRLEPGREDMPDHQALMAILHAQDADGHWYRGVDATLAAWQAAGVGRWLVWLDWPLIHRVARRVYAWFARHRMTISARLGPRVCDGQCQSRARIALDRAEMNDGR